MGNCNFNPSINGRSTCPQVSDFLDDPLPGEEVLVTSIDHHYEYELPGTEQIVA